VNPPGPGKNAVGETRDVTAAVEIAYSTKAMKSGSAIVTFQLIHYAQFTRVALRKDEPPRRMGLCDVLCFSRYRRRRPKTANLMRETVAGLDAWERDD
jgi:hypothetical protein